MLKFPGPPSGPRRRTWRAVSWHLRVGWSLGKSNSVRIPARRSLGVVPFLSPPGGPQLLLATGFPRVGCDLSENVAERSKKDWKKFAIFIKGTLSGSF